MKLTTGTTASSTTCPACLDEFSHSNILSLGCGHGLCLGCVKRLVHAYMPLPLCPTQNCRATVKEAIVEMIFGSEGVEAFRDALLERALQDMPDRVVCPNSACATVVLCEGPARHRVICACGHPPFCSRCRQPYHYHSDCSAVQLLRERWLAWLSTGRSRYASLHDDFKEFLQDRTIALVSAARCHKELVNDERYKAEHCRLCPHCFRPVEKLDGCNTMRCGANYHGGSQQSGCDKVFDWSKAPPYQAVVEIQSLPDVDIGRAVLSGAGCRHLFTRCAFCKLMVQGPRLRCIHCEALDLCMGCETRFATSNLSSHPQNHVFEVLYAPEDPPIEYMPRGTPISVFGVVGSGAVLNGCTAEVWRYSPAAGCYELNLLNGSRPVVPKAHVQPNVEDPAEAQATLELALGQQDVLECFLGLSEGSLVQVEGAYYSGATEAGSDLFQPTANVCRYDPVQGEYGLVWEEPPQWACQRCTLLNDPLARRCAVCDGTAPTSHAQVFVAVEHVQPLVSSTDEVKQVMQRHWKETRRLNAVQVANETAKYCSLDIQEGLLVRVPDSITGKAGHSGCAIVLVYTGDGNYKVRLQDKDRTFIDSKLEFWVPSEKLTPLFNMEDDPISVAELSAKRHQREEARLELVRKANALSFNCSLGLPEKTLVQVSDDIARMTGHSGCALVRLYAKDGTYKICLRDNDGTFTDSTLERWVPSDKLTPLFHMEDDPIGAAQRVVKLHQREQERLEIVRVANALARSLSLGLSAETVVQVSDDIAGVPSHSGCAIVRLNTKDGNYMVCLRDSDGLFTDSTRERWVPAEKLTPLFHMEDDPIGVAECLAERHQEEEARLRVVREANALARDCSFDLPIGTRVELVGKPGGACGCDCCEGHNCLGSLPKSRPPLTIVTHFHFRISRSSSKGYPAALYELGIPAARTGPKKLLVCQGCVQPVFWDSDMPLLAAQIAVACHTTAVARHVLRQHYAANCEVNGRCTICDHTDHLISLTGLEYPLFDSFDDFVDEENLLRGIFSYGLEKPWALQLCSIAPMRDGRDMVVQSPSGMGKTMSFVIGLLARIDCGLAACQGLIIVPTRELTHFVEKIILAIGDYMRVKCKGIIGGACIREEINALRDDQHLVVGTAGRMYDMAVKRHLKIGGVSTLVIDEADEIMARGFKDQIYDIFKMLPQQVQICLFCQNMSPDLHDFECKFTSDAVRIVAKKPEFNIFNILHFYVAIEKEEWKLDTLCDLLEVLGVQRMVVYCNTRRKLDFLADQLTKRDVSVSSLHRELDSRERDLVMREFRSGSSDVLISTDLWHDLAINDFALLINYDLPSNLEDYLHRIMRTRCAVRRRQGVAINFVTNSDVRAMKDLERYYHIEIVDMPMDIADLI